MTVKNIRLPKHSTQTFTEIFLKTNTLETRQNSSTRDEIRQIKRPRRTQFRSQHQVFIMPVRGSDPNRGGGSIIIIIVTTTYGGAPSTAAASAGAAAAKRAAPTTQSRVPVVPQARGSARSLGAVAGGSPPLHGEPPLHSLSKPFPVFARTTTRTLCHRSHPPLPPRSD